MMHSANMDARNLICSGHKVANANMTTADLDWAMASNVIRQDNQGRWFHTMITDRDRAYRANQWNPDTGPWRKGVNY